MTTRKSELVAALISFQQSMTAMPPMGLRQALIASIAVEGKKPAEATYATSRMSEGQKHATSRASPIRGNGITKLRARMHELNAALREATDLDMLAGTLRGFDDDLIECAEKLPDWYAAAETAISARRKVLQSEEFVQ